MRAGVDVLPPLAHTCHVQPLARAHQLHDVLQDSIAVQWAFAAAWDGSGNGAVVFITPTHMVMSSNMIVM